MNIEITKPPTYTAKRNKGKKIKLETKDLPPKYTSKRNLKNKK